MRLHQILDLLRAIAPEELAEPWDKVGLQLGSANQQIRKVMLCIDLTEPVLSEAVTSKTDLVVSYHPPIFEPLTALCDNHWKQRLLRTAIQKRIAVYSPHTALDAAEGGLNDWLVAGLGPGRVCPIQPIKTDHFKIVTFVPANKIDTMRQALDQAGAGRIGDYRTCSFTTTGVGTFHGEAGTKPTVGSTGRLEHIEEWRLEMTVCSDDRSAAERALIQAHPYEEPAYDVYPLENVGHRNSDGQGRLIELQRPVSVKTLATRVKKQLGVQQLEIADAGRPLRRVGICAGAGGSLLDKVPGLDGFVTGEMRHHDVLDAQARGISVLLAGHSQTERPYLPTYRRRLAGASGRTVHWRLSRRDRPPSTTS